MSVSYKAVGWNPFKKKYDLILLSVIALALVVFIGLSLALFPESTLEILLIRGFGLIAILLLHVVLVIGPMARLDSRWLPLLYNRRHLGVVLFLTASMHGFLSLLTYHAGSDVNPLVSVFATDAGSSVFEWPFQAFGAIAIIILFLMAATSHDFWLSQLTAPVWKILHMGVYCAYLLILIHIGFGVLQSETHPIYIIMVSAGLAVISTLHIMAAGKEAAADRRNISGDGFQLVCHVDDLTENIPHPIVAGGERIAVLLYDHNKVSAVSGICQHQNGPLSEGRYIHGCLTCPWHGYQYIPENGKSPAPFTEMIPTFSIQIKDDGIYLDPRPHPAGTRIEPAVITTSSN